MQLFINKKEIPLNNVEFYNWYHMIDWLLRNKIDNRQGIVELNVDDRSYRHILSDLNAEPFPTHIGRIDIITQDAYAISSSGLEKVQNLLSTLQNELPHLTTHFRSGDLASGSAHLGRFISSLIPMIDFIQSISLNFQIDFSIQLISKELTISDLLTQLQVFFETLNTAQERTDPIELADLLEFEMTPLLDNCLAAAMQLQLVLPDTALKTTS